MLVKLSLGSMKKLFKDYLILLFGLTISIAIFYMFETLAQNKAFVQGHSMIGSILLVFHVGSFILGLITLFYIFYATSFILSLRQKELGMYMTLGAKKYKVTQLMFFETFTIGFISLVIGIVVGIGLSSGISVLLMKQLGFSAKGFHPFYASSLFTTAIFYVVLFLLTSFVNAGKVARKSILSLIHADQEKDPVQTKAIKTFLGIVFALILIGAGYSAIIDIKKSLQYGFILGAVTITIGTYFLFISLLPFLLRRVKGIRRVNETGLNAFTLGQLIFRLSNLTKVLGTVAMLIALGLGAMTASLSFYNNISLEASMAHAYDLRVLQPSQQDHRLIRQLSLTNKEVYHYKVTNDGVYFLKEDLLKNPPLIKGFDPTKIGYPKTNQVSAELPNSLYSINGVAGFAAIPKPWQTALTTELGATPQMFGKRSIYIYDQSHFDKIKASKQTVLIAMVGQFSHHLTVFKKIDVEQKMLAESYTGQLPITLGSKYDDYMMFKEFASGTIFMGFFLSLAFVMMMASVLMFKLLSSAAVDTRRYQMLRKVGVRKSLLVKSIYKELFLVFLFPALIGLAHVLVGMKMFGVILVEPYTKIWLPICLFLVIYGFYYFLTVQMYKQMVLPRDKTKKA